MFLGKGVIKIPMSKYDFNKVTKHLFLGTPLDGCFRNENVKILVDKSLLREIFSNLCKLSLKVFYENR